MSLLLALTLLSSTAFLIYGVICLTSRRMRGEFERFGLGRLRVLTGVLEVLGGAGLLVGTLWRPALWLSSGGLALLMLVGVGVRVKVRDGVWQTSPALLLMLVNIYILFASLAAARRRF